MGSYLAFDTETYLIQEGMVTPPMVCLTMADHQRNTHGASTGDADLEHFTASLFEPGFLLLGQNCSFDLAVICQQFPHLIPKVWAKLEAGEVQDIRIRDMLLNLGTHGKLKYLYLPDGSKDVIKYSLEAMVARYLGVDLSAEKNMEDAWRLRYNELDGIPFYDFPEDAQQYAISDSIYVLDIYECQEAKRREIQEERGLDLLVPAAFQTAVDFALTLITARGMAVNAEKVREVEAMLNEEYHDLSKFPLLVETGIIRKPEPARVHSRQLKKVKEMLDDRDPLEHREFLEEEGIIFVAPKPASRNKKALVEVIEKVCAETRTEVKKTPKGGVSTDAEVLMNLAPYSPIIKEYQDRMALDKLVTTEMPAFHWQDKIAEVLHFNYNIMLETGRTSSFGGKHYPGRNGQQVDPRTRPCFVPRRGYWLLSSDYSALELCSTGHITKQLLGESDHHRLLSAGYDPHAFLGAQLARALHDEFQETCREMGISVDRDAIYEFFLTLKIHKKPVLRKFFKHWRKFAKPVGLGYPGGLGAKTFVTLAHKKYKVDLVEEAGKLPEEFFDEFVFHSTVIWHGKRMGLVEEDQVSEWTPKLKAIAFAQHLKEIWFATYTEMRSYFKRVTKNIDEFNTRKVIDPDTDEEKAESALCYTSPMGMHRANCTYTKAANGEVMQTPSAEGFKIAFFNVVRACHDPSRDSILHAFDCHVVNEIHDEILVEVPDNVYDANKCVREVQKIMEESMGMVLFSLPIKTEAALMRAWNKDAEPTLNDEGLLVPWEPKEEDE